MYINNDISNTPSIDVKILQMAAANLNISKIIIQFRWLTAPVNPNRTIANIHPFFIFWRVDIQCIPTFRYITLLNKHIGAPNRYLTPSIIGGQDDNIIHTTLNVNVLDGAEPPLFFDDVVH